jgi:intracellular septation protein A
MNYLPGVVEEKVVDVVEIVVVVVVVMFGGVGLGIGGAVYIKKLHIIMFWLSFLRLDISCGICQIGLNN